MQRREFLALVGVALAFRPRMAFAQSRKVPTVAYLWHAGNATEEEPFFSAIREGFAKLGYIDGQNIKLVHRFPNELPERFRSMAAELVSMNVDVLMGGSVASSYLKRATDKIPIVFMFVLDPVGLGLVQSLARPGGNATGVTNFGRDLAGKRLQLLKDLVSGLSRVGRRPAPHHGQAGDLAVTLRPKIRAFLCSRQQIRSVLSHPVVRSSVGNRWENWPRRSDPPPTLDRPGVFARATVCRKYLGPKMALKLLFIVGAPARPAPKHSSSES
jgi:ABC transporter substrate binding protein